MSCIAQQISIFHTYIYSTAVETAAEVTSSRSPHPLFSALCSRRPRACARCACAFWYSAAWSAFLLLSRFPPSESIRDGSAAVAERI